MDFLGADEHWRRIELKLSQMDPEAWVALGNDMSNQTGVLSDLGNAFGARRRSSSANTTSPSSSRQHEWPRRSRTRAS